MKTLIKFEHIIEGKVGHFLLDHDTPIDMAKVMLFEFLKRIGQIEDQIKAQQEAAKVQEPVTDEVKPDLEPAPIEAA